MSSSAVLATVCVLCAVWLAPRLLRREDTPVLAQVEARDLRAAAPPRPAGHTTVNDAPSPSTPGRENTVNTSDLAPSTAATRGPLSGLRIRWDRTLIFLAGIMLLLTALITAVMAPFTAVGWAVPAVLVLLGVGCVAGLRYLAVEDRGTRRVRTGSLPTAVAAAPRAEQKLFDNEDEARQEAAARPHGVHHPASPTGQEGAAETARPAPEPTYTVAELRAEALKVAHSSAGSAATWEPVPVPLPLYTQAPVVQRREPEPLPVPQRPAARSASLKDAVQAGSSGSDALNLDDVLKRRRA